MCSDLNRHHHIWTQMVYFSAKPVFLCSQWETCRTNSLDRMVSEWNLYLKQTYAWGNRRGLHMSSARGARGEQEQGSLLFWAEWPKVEGWGLRSRCGWRKQKDRSAWMKAADLDSQRLHVYFSVTERMLMTRDPDASENNTVCSF